MDPHPFTERDDGLCATCGLAPIAAVHADDTAPASARARADDPWTSHAAALSLPSESIRASQQAVLDVLARIGPSTDVRLVAEYRLAVVRGEVPHQADSGIRTRRSELAEDGRVEDTGRSERLPSRRWAKVWRARAAVPHDQGATP